MDIEDVAVNSPELIKKIPIDIYEGISDEVALDVAKFLNFDGPLANMASIVHKVILTFYNLSVNIYFLYLLLIGCQRNKKIMGILFVNRCSSNRN